MKFGARMMKHFCLESFAKGILLPIHTKEQKEEVVPKSIMDWEDGLDEDDINEIDYTGDAISFIEEIEKADKYDSKGVYAEKIDIEGEVVETIGSKTLTYESSNVNLPSTLMVKMVSTITYVDDSEEEDITPKLRQEAPPLPKGSNLMMDDEEFFLKPSHPTRHELTTTIIGYIEDEEIYSLIIDAILDVKAKYMYNVWSNEAFAKSESAYINLLFITNNRRLRNYVETKIKECSGASEVDKDSISEIMDIVSKELDVKPFTLMKATFGMDVFEVNKSKTDRGWNTDNDYYKFKVSKVRDASSEASTIYMRVKFLNDTCSSFPIMSKDFNDYKMDVKEIILAHAKWSENEARIKIGLEKRYTNEEILAHLTKIKPITDAAAKKKAYEIFGLTKEREKELFKEIKETISEITNKTYKNRFKKQIIDSEAGLLDPNEKGNA